MSPFFSIFRFFLSSIEAAVEHIRRGSVDDILKGLPPAKVNRKIVYKINVHSEWFRDKP